MLRDFEPNIPSELETAVIGAMAPNPDRHLTAADLESRLRRFLGPTEEAGTEKYGEGLD
jgi:hypothetical protein